MASPLCGTGLYANDVLCEVINKLDDLNEIYIEIKDQALESLDDLKDLSENEIGGFSDIDYSADTSSVNKSFSPPSTVPSVPDLTAGAPPAPELPTSPSPFGGVDTAPTAPEAYVVPEATDLLIQADVFNAVYERDADRLAAASQKEERDAQYSGSAMGIGMSAAAISKRLSRARENASLRVLDNAHEKAIQEGTWLREDVKTLHGYHIQNWPLKPQLALDTYKAQEGLEVEGYSAEAGAYKAIADGRASVYRSQVDWALGHLNAETSRYQAATEQLRAEIASEAERRGWSEMELRQILEEADKGTQYAIEKAKNTLENSYRAQEAIAQLMVGLAQGIFSSADYSLSGSGSQSISESV